MTGKGQYCAVPPAPDGPPTGAGGPDALSELLHGVRLRGDALTRWAPDPPWDITIAGGTRMLHIAESGPLRLRVAGQRSAVTLDPGDLALLSRGDAHSIRYGPPTAARVLVPADRHRREAGDRTPSWLTGTFAVEDDVAGPLLSVLPPVIVIRARAGAGEWMGLSLALLLDEMTDPRPGAAVMISRILDLLFIHALREWSASDEPTPGWLTAAMDATLGPVLTAIHRSPGHAWSVAELAEHAGLSRSAFAARFTRLLGRTPAAYVAQRRLDHAAHLITETTLSIGHVGRQAGYASDAAFSRAFTRRHGMSPRAWRRDTTTSTGRRAGP